MDFIDKNKNYMFSKFNINDLREYLNFLNNYLTEYRNTIELNKKITFGLEFEYEDIDKINIDQFIKDNFKSYNSDYEEDFDFGGEIISPILTDNIDTWLDVKKICNYLKEKNAIVDISAGAHVHVGVSELGKNIEKFKQFILLYIAYEHILYRFANGERIDTRYNQIAVAYPISITYAELYKEIIKSKDYNDIEKLLIINSTRFQGLNLKNIKFDDITKNSYKNTIEFRMANGTKEEVIWQNLVNTYTKMINSSIINEFDMDKLIEKIKIIKNVYLNYSYFNKLYIKEALEFADIIFNNNLDKSNFLRQYIKDGRLERDCELGKPTYSKRFIK